MTDLSADHQALLDAINQVGGRLEAHVTSDGHVDSDQLGRIVDLLAGPEQVELNGTVDRDDTAGLMWQVAALAESDGQQNQLIAQLVEQRQPVTASARLVTVIGLVVAAAVKAVDVAAGLL